MTKPYLKTGVLFCRTLQAMLAGLAALVILGAFLANLNLTSFMPFALFAIVLLAFALVLEGVARLVKGVDAA